MFGLARSASKLGSGLVNNAGSTAMLQRFFTGDAKDQRIGVIGIGAVGRLKLIMLYLLRLTCS